LSYGFDEELLIDADEELIRRMTMNLLDNAIKYTREGGSVRVECRRVDGHYTLTVTDTGSGIPIDVQERIFERFFRADKARSYSSAESAGAGLGLPIARWIAEAHRGRLELLRSDNTGSTFGVFLPVT
jgi:signal transduction histidine kinase